MKYDLFMSRKLHWGEAKHRGSMACAFSGTASALEVWV